MHHYQDLRQMEVQGRAKPLRTEVECDQMVEFMRQAGRMGASLRRKAGSTDKPADLLPAKKKSKKVKRSSAS